MPEIPTDCNLDSYRFELPERLIAQHPAQRRETSRLMVVSRDAGTVGTARFSDLGRFLPPDCLLVANNSRVVPARLVGAKPTGGRVELLLLTPPPLLEPHPADDGWRQAEAEGLLKASKGPRPGEEVTFSSHLRLQVLERGDFGRSRVRLAWRGELTALMEELGRIPLPPYIHRDANAPTAESDRQRYQTVYASPDKAGSVAAPTAGLHFTPELRRELLAGGRQWTEVTLYVGYGTFSPVRTADIREHRMHAEHIEISAETARAVARAKAEGRPVVAVGTTSARTLEGAFAATGGIEPYIGETDIFICPGYRFQVVDQLLTNFHLPGSSLIMMVSALAGRETVLDAYRRAVAEEFRFFSYGDAMLVR